MDFDHDDFDDDDFSEEEFEKRRKEAENHPLRKQAKEILKVLNLILASSDGKSNEARLDETLLESAYIINAKLAGAIGSDSYIVCMQNASIIRSHAEYLRLSNHSLNTMTKIDKKYISVLRSEMEKFRELFILWCEEIRKMKENNEFEDEWGLF